MSVLIPNKIASAERRLSSKVHVWRPMTAAILLSSFAMAPLSPGLSKPASTIRTGHWELVETKFTGRPTCLLIGAASQNTVLTLKIDSGDEARNLISFQFVNLNWSIKSGDDLGEIALLNSTGGPTAIPIAGEKGFFFYLDAGNAQTWLKLGDKRGLWLERDGKVLERINSDDLPDKIEELRKCGARLLADDPFGD